VTIIRRRSISGSNSGRKDGSTSNSAWFRPFRQSLFARRHRHERHLLSRAEPWRVAANRPATTDAARNALHNRKPASDRCNAAKTIADARLGCACLDRWTGVPRVGRKWTDQRQAASISASASRIHPGDSVIRDPAPIERMAEPSGDGSGLGTDRRRNRSDQAVVSTHSPRSNPRHPLRPPSVPPARPARDPDGTPIRAHRPPTAVSAPRRGSDRRRTDSGCGSGSRSAG
jgi:hypothetical protein